MQERCNLWFGVRIELPKLPAFESAATVLLHVVLSVLKLVADASFKMLALRWWLCGSELMLTFGLCELNAWLLESVPLLLLLLLLLLFFVTLLPPSAGCDGAVLPSLAFVILLYPSDALSTETLGRKDAVTKKISDVAEWQIWLQPEHHQLRIQA